VCACVTEGERERVRTYNKVIQSHTKIDMHI